MDEGITEPSTVTGGGDNRTIYLHTMVEGIAGPYSIQQLRVVEGSTEPFIVVEED
jgi:hypothetical protein